MSRGPVSVEPEPRTEAPLEVLPGPAEVTRRRRLRWLLPLAVIALVPLALWMIFATRPAAVTRDPVLMTPLVRVIEVAPETLRVQIVAHGTVAPRTESDLVAEVSGRILSVSPALEVGSFFEEGEELLRLDARQHVIAVERARASVKLRSSEERLAAAEARRRRELARRGAVSDADLEQFESRALVAAASLDEARAALAQAELDLERTTVRAPFAGRVRERSVDVGQFVSSGTTLARIYAVDYAEVRLPIRTDDLSYLDLDLGIDEAADGDAESPVRLSARLGGRELEWPARLVRSEGDIDLRTRMLHVVARVDDPYARDGAGHSPLPAGLFVRAEIEGSELDGVFVVPAPALREGNRVYVVDAEDRLRIRPVEVLRRRREDVVVGSGLAAGERVIVSPLRAVTEGMAVRTTGSERT